MGESLNELNEGVSKIAKRTHSGLRFLRSLLFNQYGPKIVGIRLNPTFQFLEESNE